MEFLPSSKQRKVCPTSWVAKNTMKSGIEIMCMNNYLVMANVVF
jgi:hypothetical protein